MAKPPDKKPSFSDRLSKHWMVTVIVIVSGIATVIGVGYQILGPEPTPPPLPTAVAEPASPNVPLNVIDAEVEPFSRTRRLFWIIPIGADEILSYEAAIQNAGDKMRKSCRAVTKYAGPLVEGSGLLFFGSWTNWYDGKGSSHYFNIPANSSANYRFFWFPERMKVWPLEWVRVRVICEKPTKQISRWYDINLSRVRWP